MDKIELYTLVLEAIAKKMKAAPESDIFSALHGKGIEKPTLLKALSILIENDAIYPYSVSHSTQRHFDLLGKGKEIIKPLNGISGENGVKAFLDELEKKEADKAEKERLKTITPPTPPIQNLGIMIGGDNHGSLSDLSIRNNLDNNNSVSLNPNAQTALATNAEKNSLNENIDKKTSISKVLYRWTDHKLISIILFAIISTLFGLALRHIGIYDFFFPKEPTEINNK